MAQSNVVADSTQMVLPEKTLFDVLRDIWRAKFYILFFVCICMAMAFAFLSVARGFYRADLVISPAINLAQGTHMVGYRSEGSPAVSFGQESTDAFSRFVQVYDGVSVATILLTDKKIRDGLTDDLSFEFSKPQREWTPELLSEYIERRVVIEPVHGTEMRRMFYLHPRKQFAAHFLSRIHLVADELIRARILRDVNARISYLEEALTKTNNPAHQRNFTALLLEQERVKMLVSLEGQPFSADIVEPASVSFKEKWPAPYLVYPVFIFVGILFGFVLYGLRHGT
ncbi:MAG: hypothetical protein ACRBDL_11470 [Alphaproteobacteria bacterium]